VLLIFKDQISFGKQINELIIQTFLSTKLNKEIIGDAFKQVESKTFIKCIQTFKDVLVDYDEITLVNADDIVNKIQKITGFTKKDLFFPLRFAAIAQQHGPQMNKILYIVGKKQILENIEKIIGLFKVEL
jgi:glutamyl/glutaminyl-tRNA synthetase